MTTPGAVIIATRHRPEALVRCLRAVIAGSSRPQAVVVVDQGSRRVETEARAALDGTNIELRYVAVPEGGVSRARNAGLAAAAEFDVIAFTDDDCVPAQDWLSQLGDALVPAAAAATGRVLPLPSPQRGLVARSSRTRTTARLHGPESLPWEAGTGGNLCLRRRAIESVGGFDERFGPGAPFKAAEDLDLLHRLLRGGHTVAYAPEAVVYHEMQTLSARFASRFPYGFGMGALVATRIGESGESTRLAKAYAGLQASTVARGVTARSARLALEPLVGLAGFAAGFAACLARDHAPHR